MPDDHPLDRPVWTALTTRHAGLSVGGLQARRFREDISPLAGLRDESEESLAALAALVPETLPIVLPQRAPIPCPPGVVISQAAMAAQLVFRGPSPLAVSRPDILRLGPEDAPEMAALAELTKPGPYRIGSQGMGAFWGVRIDGRLVAMAGERLKQPGYTEVSGVCTHPDARGMGLGRALSACVIRGVLNRGETPYLHAYSTNEPALRLYRSLGFVARQELHVAVMERRGV